MSVWPNFNIWDGTEDRDRLPRALEQGYFLADERRFVELLALAFELAQTLPFRDLQNAPKRDWGDLFAANEAVVMAHMVSTDPQRLESKFSKCHDMGIEHTVRLAYETAGRIDFWLSALGDSPTRAAIELRERIEAPVQEHLAEELQALWKIVKKMRQSTQSLDDLDFRDFDRIWGIEPGDDEGTPSSAAVPPTSFPEGFGDAVRRIFLSFLSVIANLRTVAPPYLIESLQTQAHEPAIALFMVFLKLLEKARDKSNGFTRRHLDFYYRRALGAAPRQHEPDQVFLSPQIAKGQSNVRIPAGTAFVTKAPEGGGEIIVVSEQDAVISDARVKSVCTLRFDRDRFISPERELGYVTRVKALQRHLEPEEGSLAPPPALHLFGESSRLASDESVDDARIGFAIASPALLLGEGQRTIEVQLEFGNPGESSHLRDGVIRGPDAGVATIPDRLALIFADFLSAERDSLEAVARTDTIREAKQLVSSLDVGEIEKALTHKRKGQASAYELFLKALLRQPIGGAEAFHSLLGRIFRHYVLISDEYLSTKFKAEIAWRARKLLDRESVKDVIEHLKRSRELVFQKLLKDVFSISLTVPAGWHRVDEYVMTRLGGDGGPRRGVRVLLSLDAEDDPIVPYSPEIHGGQWGGTSPMIRFRLNSLANFYAYSLFNASRLAAVVIDVKVRGLRNLELYNNVGRVDPSKPFQPFGPVPTLSSYLAFGSYEISQKELSALTLNLEWGDLPTCFGGFATHYAGYEQPKAGEDFRADVSALKDGVWQPQSDRKRDVVALFQAAGATKKLKVFQSIEIGCLDFLRPIDPSIAEDEFDLRHGMRNGFVRVGLNGPEGAFGHSNYPILLSKTLSENIRSKKMFKDIPNSPYTPLIVQISADYAAQARIQVDESRPKEGSARAQRIFHLHPFGYEEVEPIRAGKPFSLLPKYETDGNLLIAVDGDGARHAITLLFHLTEVADQQGASEKITRSAHAEARASEKTIQQSAFESPGMVWYYLSVQGWRPLPATCIALDTTRRFLCSGLVTLTLPEDVDRESTLMPSGMVWLRVGANTHLDTFPRLESIHANGLRAVRQIDPEAKETLIEHLPAGCTWQPALANPGLGTVLQVGRSFGGVPTENRRRFVTRTCERLRHKERAVTPWDVERIVLQRFPEVFKVKCFPGLTTSDSHPKPGHLLVVVVAHAVGGDSIGCQRPMLDVLQLTEICKCIRAVSSPFVTVEVRNPLFERIQVRCKAKFKDDANPGFYVRKLNGEVSRFLCPWVPFGYRARFGWMISRVEVEGFIWARDYVEFVTDFSMLHIAEDTRDSYTLEDTVSRYADDPQEEGLNATTQPSRRQIDRVRWRYPWSLAVPMERHCVQALPVPRYIEPEPTGINELEIGGTFIIGGTDQP